ncbi:hypothetical protein ACHAWU_004176 [Discostella pseudostelligera]|uniref:Transmembrane protein n=1 Tax=Discostella pseudostelligera TaxID=259834 RepID=A0ABD3M6P1_9STRA
MTRGMNTMPTIRHGRTYYRPGPADKNRGPIINICSVLFITGLLLVPPLLFLGSERARHVRYLTLRHALSESDAIIELNRHHSRSSQASGSSDQKIQRMVHGISHNISTIAYDSDTRISIPGALTLRRTPEYCQWQELQSQSCQTCTRSVTAKDGTTKDENYQCNCVIQYDYIKAWRSYRINSLLFDQPGAHYNPQRDPMPYRMMVSDHAKLTFGDEAAEYFDESTGDTGRRRRAEDSNNFNRQGAEKNIPIQAILDPSMLASGVRNQPYRRLEFTPDGIPPPPSFFSRIFSSIFGSTTSSSSSRYTRYEPLQSLRDMPYSPAATSDNFVYAGQGGYFFSPYESTTASKLFNLFTQYLEGSLFDWQIGDLMPSCVAGDVRFYYEVQDPNVVSVLGQSVVGVGGRIDSEVPIVIKPRAMMVEGVSTTATPSETTIGLVHSGSHSAVDMLIAEDADSRNRATMFRGLVLFWSIPASRMLGVAMGRDMGASTWTSQIMGVLGVFCGMLGAAWLMIWGQGDANGLTWLFLVAGGTFSYLALQSAWRTGGERRWHAVWCLIARWANLPPEWRVEDSYVTVSPDGKVDGKVGGGDSPKKMS